jgi:hypothetical protein
MTELIRIMEFDFFSMMTSARPVLLPYPPTGKRFGLTASRNLAVGELLLVTPPLTVAFGPAGKEAAAAAAAAAATPSHMSAAKQAHAYSKFGHTADEAPGVCFHVAGAVERG